MTETKVQIAVMKHYATRGAAGAFLFACPNGGSRRSKGEGAILKAMGVRAGVPDLIGIRDGRCYGLELKIDHGGRVAPEQVETMQAMQSAGATVAVAAGLDDALHKLEAWGILRGAAA